MMTLEVCHVRCNAMQCNVAGKRPTLSDFVDPKGQRESLYWGHHHHSGTEMLLSTNMGQIFGVKETKSSHFKVHRELFRVCLRKTFCDYGGTLLFDRGNLSKFLE